MALIMLSDDNTLSILQKIRKSLTDPKDPAKAIEQANEVLDNLINEMEAEA